MLTSNPDTSLLIQELSALDHIEPCRTALYTTYIIHETTVNDLPSKFRQSQMQMCNNGSVIVLFIYYFH